MIAAILNDTARVAPEEQGANVPLPAVFSLRDASTLESGMAKKSYWELLRDPRWQRRRLEIMERAGFACEMCDSKTDTLNVHHKIYRKGAMPWEYPDSELRCLCEKCHEAEHGLKRRLDEAIAVLASSDLEQIVGFAEGCVSLQKFYDNPDDVLEITSIEHAVGVDASLRTDSVAAYELLDACLGSARAGYRISSRALYTILCERHHRKGRLPPEEGA